MNNNQEKIFNILNTLPNYEHCKIKPATIEQIAQFIEIATEQKLETKLIEELVEFYQVADAYEYDGIFGFHSCAMIK